MDREIGGWYDDLLLLLGVTWGVSLFEFCRLSFLLGLCCGLRIGVLASCSVG